MLRAMVAALVIVLACNVAVRAQGRIVSPTQAAYLKGEIKKAQQEYVAKVAAISGVARAKIKEWVAIDGRDVPPKLSLIPALQRERGKPFSDTEREQLLAADQERFDAIAKANREALNK